MNAKLQAFLVLLALLAGVHQVTAQGTAFTYQGRLSNGGSPASGLYDFRFRLYTDPFGSVQVGSNFLTNGVPATNGLFTVTIDFGAGIFTGTTNWLEVGVRTNGGGIYMVLNPLQNLTPTPYAIFAETASNLSGVLPAAQLSGPVSSANLSGTYVNPVNLNNAGNNFNGTFTGNGGGLTNLNAWGLSGNIGTVPGMNFLGTADNQPLEVRVNNQRAFRIENTTGTANIIGGWSNNFAAPGVVMATIGGGGGQSVVSAALYTNSVWSSYGTVGGGIGNQAGDTNADTTLARGATVGGGGGNIAGALFSTISGGDFNTVFLSGDYSFIGGGDVNLIEPGAAYSTIGGGYNNIIQTNSSFSFIGGGYQNQATNSYATVLGGFLSVAGGTYSLAAGVGARALHEGAMVLADSQFNYFDSTTSNEFSIRAQNGVRIQSDVGIHLNAADEPLIVRDWDVFATNAPPDKAGIGRWGLFMEPEVLTIGIPSDDIPFRYFQVAKYDTNGTPTSLMWVDQGGNVTATSFNASGGGTFSGNGAGLTSIPAASLTGTIAAAQLPANVALLNASQTFSGANTMSNAANSFNGTFSGNGSGLAGVPKSYFTGGFAGNPIPPATTNVFIGPTIPPLSLNAGQTVLLSASAALGTSAASLGFNFSPSYTFNGGAVTFFAGLNYLSPLATAAGGRQIYSQSLTMTIPTTGTYVFGCGIQNTSSTNLNNNDWVNVSALIFK